VSKQAYFPARGDIMHVNLSPAAGKEFALRHYALVISTLAFSKATGLCIALPMTTKFHADQRLHQTALMMQVPKLQGLNEQGWVYIHQIKTLDYRQREAEYKTKIDDDNLDFLIEVMERVRALIDPDSIG
jgi:mRNA-degrading endonuclease toxin of MazEF toxin-antitoxin module